MQLSFLLLLPLALAQNKVKGPDYLALSAAEKQNLIWENVVADTSSADWPSSLALGTIFLESMCPTLKQEGDQLPTSFFGDRKKLIHSVGTVAKVKFVSNGNHPYTGIFQGANHGIARLSLAKEPSADELNTAPGIGLKFLRDGVDSANVVAMFGVNGQDSWNFFANDFSNHIAAAEGLSLTLLANKFATATPYIQQVGLSDWGETGEDGELQSAVRFPYKLRLQPTGDITFNDTYHGLFTDDLVSIPEGSLLYNVFAWDQPSELGGTEQLIGELVTTSPMVTSVWGDSSLFFRHQDMREDVDKYFPEWAEYTEQVDVLGFQKCLFH